MREFTLSPQRRRPTALQRRLASFIRKLGSRKPGTGGGGCPTHQLPPLPTNVAWVELIDTDFESGTTTPVPDNVEILALQLTAPAIDVTMFYEDGALADRYSRLVPDPKDAGNQVLHYWLDEAAIPRSPGADTPFKGRISVKIDERPRDFTQTHRMMFSSDWQAIIDHADAVTWCTVVEYFSGRYNGASPYQGRLTVNVKKQTGVGEPLRFGVSFQVDTAGTGSWTSIWSDITALYEIPLDEWIDMKIEHIQGDVNNGSLKLSTGGVGAWVDHIDVINWTVHPTGPDQTPPITQFGACKLYLADTEINRCHPGTMQMWWDDLKVMVPEGSVT